MGVYFNRIVTGGVCVIFVSAAFSQQGNLDPTILSPDIYKTVLENNAVRVIQVNVFNGSQPAIHSHPDRVVIYVTDCTWVRAAEDGQVIEKSYRAGEVLWADATTHGGQVNHVRKACTLLEVELK